MRVGCEVLGAPGKRFGACGTVYAVVQDSLPTYRHTCFLNVRFKAGPML